MTRLERKAIEDLYEAIKTGKTVLGFDEGRGVGTISLVDYRRDETQLLLAAEILSPLLIPVLITE